MGKLSEAVLNEIRKHKKGLTADEVAAKVGRSILAVRPTVSLLHTSLVVIPTGEKRRNQSGLMANVWVATHAHPSV